LTPTLLQFLFRIDALVSCTFSVLACTYSTIFKDRFPCLSRTGLQR